MLIGRELVLGDGSTMDNTAMAVNSLEDCVQRLAANILETFHKKKSVRKRIPSEIRKVAHSTSKGFSERILRVSSVLSVRVETCQLIDSVQSTGGLTVESDVKANLLEESYLFVRTSRPDDLESFTLSDLTSDLTDSS